ncbi:uncharacterized protein MELLADRAFT_59440 [Melampsora larici-populina 98AG31]|uniref:Uncharacterized protein n=1 Tax=Melampsora larici-populina (strain 98AG31 / pathotype 3-4-7) TaxID=747676 RepID=F4R7H4_MELLP|nr:uncharacterized protein MELLADRAFT_59440 [Melampsora larici-populina 98AG31]EGG11318.1 hypothetical protein MELLADRAFT_59440 [Melampsora larici-populina 98AG31]
MPGLDESHIEMGSWLSHCDTPADHAINLGLFLSKIHQDVLDGQASIRDELMDRIDTIKDNISNDVIERVQEHLDSGEKLTFQLGCQHVIDSSIEAYTAIIRKPNKTIIENSLFRKIKGLPWCTEQLPPKPNGIALTSDTQTLATMIKEKAKHARENLHTVVLNLIVAVSDVQGQYLTFIRLLDWSVSLYCYIHKEETTEMFLFQIVHVDNGVGESRSSDEIWDNTDMISCTRYAYLRRECLRIYHPNKATSTIWTEVDNQLEYLRSKGRPYTTCFYNILYQQDRKRFDKGTVMYDNIPLADRSFKMPSDDEIQAEIPKLQSRKTNKKANKKTPNKN